ncbi:putative transcription factor C2C2-GATA family [Helianthus annuus]|nr:putative transcription factor C2C2-GATA family [Helianthus annuus]
MTPIYFNSSSDNQYNEHQFFSPRDHHNQDEFLSPNSQASLSSNSLTCHIFFNPITTHDQDKVFNRDQSHPSQNEDDDDVGSQACDDPCVKNQVERSTGNGGLQVSLWKKEDDDHMNEENQVKWMSSKMRVMLKMKKTDPTKLDTLRSTTKELPLEGHHDHKEQERANSINSNYSNNTLIRVCSDCNTTKTPLWRSGPQGPKSLCNACGIRQRKARKAMAAAQAEAAESSKSEFVERPTSLKATKILHKDYKKPNKGHVTKYNNKLYSKKINTKAAPTRKNTVEEFLVSLSKSLAFHGVFPQDEKEAAILLMALSCGYVHQ